MAQLESFFWGIIAALGALVVQLVVYIGFSSYTGSNAADVSFAQLFTIPIFIIMAVLIEESLKYLVISQRIEMLSQERFYIINSLFVGLGFFITELGLIFLPTSSAIPTNSLWEIAIIHIGTAGIIGYIVALKNPKKISTFLFAVTAASFFHGAYNLLIIRRTFVLNYAIFAMLAMIILINIVNLIRINKRT